jgi:hypothetical protein
MSVANTSNHRSPRRLQRVRAQRLISDIVVGVLAFFVLLCVGLITPPLWNALTRSTEPKLFRCEGIKNALERLACEDTMSDGPAHPAKGATAPLGDAERRGRADR